MSLSVCEQLEGRVVLITGGLGGVGSVCLEQLLRLTEVKAVYLLVRARHGKTAKQRVQTLLASPLFHSLHADARLGVRNVFSKVHVIEGNLQQPGLGMSEEDRDLVVREVDCILHCAADLALDAHIQRTLRVNFCGTKQLTELASQMPSLVSFIFVSTFYVSNFVPHSSAVKESVHYLPLQLPGDTEPLTYHELVDLLLWLPPESAAHHVAALMSELNFGSTYAFGKLLTEALVDDPATLPGVAKGIVRPSLVCGLAGQPYPGFCPAFVGGPSAVLAYGVGLYHDTAGWGYAGDDVVDVVPVDVTSALIIAAAAKAAAQGPQAGGRAKVYHAASSASHPLTSRQLVNMLRTFWTAHPSPVRLPLARLPLYPPEQQKPSGVAVGLMSSLAGLLAFVARAVLLMLGVSQPAAQELGLSQGNSGGLSAGLGAWAGAAVAWLCGVSPSTTNAARHWSHCMTGLKVWAAAAALRAVGSHRQAAQLVSAYRVLCVMHQPTYTRSFVCLVDNARQLQDDISLAEAPDWQCVWDSTTSGDLITYMLTFMAGARALAYKLPSPEGCNGTDAALFVRQPGLDDLGVIARWMQQESSGGNGGSSRSSLQDAEGVVVGCGPQKSCSTASVDSLLCKDQF